MNPFILFLTALLPFAACATTLSIVKTHQSFCEASQRREQWGSVAFGRQERRARVEHWNLAVALTIVVWVVCGALFWIGVTLAS